MLNIKNYTIKCVYKNYFLISYSDLSIFPLFSEKELNLLNFFHKSYNKTLSVTMTT